VPGFIIGLALLLLILALVCWAARTPESKHHGEPQDAVRKSWTGGP
jgi:hypothetical protein